MLVLLKVVKLLFSQIGFTHFDLENESTGLNYADVLRQLTPEKVAKLIELKQDEMRMFGYSLDPDTLDFGYLD